jgi:GNAT superfamily N-acetyltransferase
VAVDGNRQVGFVHASFGPNEHKSDLCTSVGVTCMLMVRPEYWSTNTPDELLRRSEDYLRSRGAQVLYGGGTRPLNGFYLGLYGGSELPGVLESDTDAQRLYRSHQYVAVENCLLFHRELTSFRPPVNRQQLQVRRRSAVCSTADPATDTWWDACTLGNFDRVRFELLPRDGGAPLATATFWNMEPLSSTWGTRAAGLIHLEVDTTQRRQGLATCLLSEAFRQLQADGISLVEAQTLEHDTALIELFRGLEFKEIERGTIFRKDA